MAADFDVSGLSDYLNQHDQVKNIFMKSMYGNDTAPYLTQLGGIKHKMALPSHDLDADILQAGDVTLDDTKFKGQVSTSKVDLAVDDLAVWMKFTIRELESFYLNLILPPGSNYDASDTNAVLGVMIGDRISQRVLRQLEANTWQGDTASGTAYIAKTDGLLKKLAGVTAISTGAISKTNARTYIDELIDTASANADFAAKLGQTGGCYLYTGHDVIRMYAQQYRADFTSLPYNGTFDKMMPDGTVVKMIGCSGLTGQSTVLLSDPSVLVQGADLPAEKTQIQVDMDQFKEFVWVKIRFKIGFAVRDTSSASLYMHKAA